MNLQKADEAVKKALSEKRYAHTIRVASTAEELGREYGGDLEKIKSAALLHDYAKCFTKEQLKNKIQQYGLSSSLFDYHHELWHAPVAAAIMEHEFGIQDEDVLNAVCYHTTGRPGMTKVEQIIFVADYIEPGRQIPGIDKIRELATTDLFLTAKEALKKTITYLMLNDNTVHPNSFFAYNWMIEQWKGR